MRIIIIGLLTCVTVSARSQTPDWYKNLEKYWWYRYQLVNDFMVLGTGAGETIPAQRRNLSPWKQNDEIKEENGFNSFSFEEPTMCLGSYLVALACEEKQAHLFGIDRNRTKDETRLGLLAYERLDKFAETYSTNVDVSNEQYPGNITNFYRDTTDHGDLNGFFIRDDVPWEHLVQDNWLHFNRPARRVADSVIRVTDCSFRDRVTMPSHHPPGNSLYPPSYPPWWVSPSTADFQKPNEESQDQLVNLVMGLGLVRHLTEEGHLQTKAGENVHRMLHHVGKTNYSSLYSLGAPMSPFIIVNEAHPTGFWFNYTGPMTFHTRHWVGCAAPDAGGAWMGMSGKGIINTVGKLTNFLGPGPTISNAHYELKLSPWHRYAYWLSQWGTFHKDWPFAATFAAFATDWHLSRWSASLLEYEHHMEKN